MRRLKLIYTYYQSLFLINVGVSILFSFLMGMGKNFFEYFYLCFVLAGFFVSALYFHYFRKQEYYFYYNRSCSKLRLIISAFVLNLIIGTLILQIVRHAKLP
jgi:hypothetical protein